MLGTKSIYMYICVHNVLILLHERLVISCSTDW
jgi:hypothetical protein